jgi:hypothetical protein
MSDYVAAFSIAQRHGCWHAFNASVFTAETHQHGGSYEWAVPFFGLPFGRSVDDGRVTSLPVLPATFPFPVNQSLCGAHWRLGDTDCYGWWCAVLPGSYEATKWQFTARFWQVHERAWLEFVDTHHSMIDVDIVMHIRVGDVSLDADQDTMFATLFEQLAALASPRHWTLDVVFECPSCESRLPASHAVLHTLCDNGAAYNCSACRFSSQLTVRESLQRLILGDVLVTSGSSFSYMAALVHRGVVLEREPKETWSMGRAYAMSSSFNVTNSGAIEPFFEARSRLHLLMSEWAQVSADSHVFVRKPNVAGGATPRQPVDELFAARDVRDAIVRREAWLHGAEQLVERLYDDMPTIRDAVLAWPNMSGRGHRQFDVIGPIAPRCRQLEVFGDGEDAMRFCGSNFAQVPCVVVALGSSGRWSFEEAVVLRTPCRVVTFDCTLAELHPPEHLTDRVQAFRICLAMRNFVNAQGWQFMDWSTAMAHAKVHHVTYLKMDIEGFEIEVLRDLERLKPALLPMQISFELHYQTQMADLAWSKRFKTPAELVLFMIGAQRLGYFPVDRVDNVDCPHCTKLLFVRFQHQTDSAAARQTVLNISLALLVLLWICK